MLPGVVFVIIFALTVSLTQVNAQFFSGQNDTVYAPNSTYRTNIDAVLSYLVSNATAPSGFHSATAGQGKFAVNGLFFCRGDVTPAQCRHCVANSTDRARLYLPGARGATIFADFCTLRYSNETILSKLLLEQSFTLWNPQKTSDPDRFNEAWNASMMALKEEIVNGTAGVGYGKKLFGTKVTAFTTLQKIMSLAQCSPDLTASDCDLCLTTSIAQLPGCCFGQRGGRVMRPSCYIRSEIYSFYADPPGLDTSPTQFSFPEPDVQSLDPITDSSGDHGMSTGVILAIVMPLGVGSIVAVFAIWNCCLYLRKRKKFDASKEKGESMMEAESLQFSFDMIQAATNSFCQENKIGEGGFGDVYLGLLPEGTQIAVKRLSKCSRQGAREFENEVHLVARLQHRNLVRLLGFCLEGPERILIYEFVPNKSLDHFLSDPEKQSLLDWPQRYTIIHGIARGLLGYMPPEYAMHGHYSAKSDVYSFGVLVLEIITGKKNGSFCQSDKVSDIVSYAWKDWINGHPLELLDSYVGEKYSRNECACHNLNILCTFDEMEHGGRKNNLSATMRKVEMDSEDNDTSNSIFQNNLNTLLHSLSSSNDTNFGFYNLAKGEGGDKVSSIALCRGDTSELDCQRCVKFSTVDLPQRCPFRKEAIIWYDNCMFRYANRSIYQSLEDPGIYMWSRKNVSDVGRFNQALKNLLPILQQQASSGDSNKKFAVGDTNYTKSTKIYALMQCTPDLTVVQCGNCLAQAFSYIDPYPEREGARVLGASCIFRFDTNPFYQNMLQPMNPSTSTTPTTEVRMCRLRMQNYRGLCSLDRYVKLSQLQLQPKLGLFGYVGNKVRNTIIIVVSTICFVILTGSIYILVLRRKRDGRLAKLETDSFSIFILTALDEIVSAESLLFDFETIKSATNNFSDDNKLGQGGFGSVYKGKLADGVEIAVKRLANGSGQGDIEFKNEVVLLAELQHKNLVRLLGFCLEGSERLLIYEFIPNASLDHFLFDPVKCAVLDWERRYKIIGGIARGLLYLHEDSRLRIIHRDLKASNILLDEEMDPKIADFGMARLGYMAPEYAMHGQFSVKTDVYSFGVILLELVSGQRTSCFQVGNTSEDLTGFAWECWRSGSTLNLVDPAIINGPSNEIMRCIHIGLLCVQENVTARPSMATVVLMLSSFSLSFPLPSEPAFFIHSGFDAEQPIRAELSSGTSNSKQLVSGNCSINDVSVTELHSR
ncbi:unnamed protein product [Rhodiola kirilowii]